MRLSLTLIPSERLRWIGHVVRQAIVLDLRWRDAHTGDSESAGHPSLRRGEAAPHTSLSLSAVSTIAASPRAWRRR